MQIGGTIDLNNLVPHLKKELGAVFSLDTTAIWKKVAVALETGAKNSFNSSTSPDGAPWSPLKHRRIRGGDKPLLDRGLLRASLTSNAPFHIVRAIGNTLEWGTNLISAAVHNFGAVLRPKTGKWLCIPASIDALQVGSPTRFPDAKNRIRWSTGKTSGIVYEDLNKTPKRIKGFKRKKHKADKMIGKNIIIHYYLTKQVTIPARRFIGISAQTNEEIRHIIQEEVFKAIKVKLL